MFLILFYFYELFLILRYLYEYFWIGFAVCWHIVKGFFVAMFGGGFVVHLMLFFRLIRILSFSVLPDISSGEGLRVILLSKFLGGFTEWLLYIFYE